MNCASLRNGGGRARIIRGPASRRGLTLIELLVAVLILLFFMAGAVVAFLEILQTSSREQVRLDGVANVRHALDSISGEVKRIRVEPFDPTTTCTGPSQVSAFTLAAEGLLARGGDFIDQDQDGQIDEELTNGADEDTDRTADPSRDRHVLLNPQTVATSGSLYERPEFFGQPDLGDVAVDEDPKLGRSRLAFETFPLAGGGSRRTVEYFVERDPVSNTDYLQQTVRDFDVFGNVERETTAPIAEKVVAFDVLVYDQRIAADNLTSATPSNPWRTDWNSAAAERSDCAARAALPEIPVSVYVVLTVYTGVGRRADEVGAAEKLPTLSMRTMVNVEAVLADPRFTTNVRPPTLP